MRSGLASVSIRPADHLGMVLCGTAFCAKVAIRPSWFGLTVLVLHVLPLDAVVNTVGTNLTMIIAGHMLLGFSIGFTFHVPGTLLVVGALFVSDMPTHGPHLPPPFLLPLDSMPAAPLPFPSAKSPWRHTRSHGLTAKVALHLRAKRGMARIPALRCPETLLPSPCRLHDSKAKSRRDFSSSVP
ncbi:hypothetical protein HU200_040792 [Digitaria exilis]|uniref:Uncharacterized protein n=1 Tax=Digitaria exilis TaxID=1010633 RepID=A0A835EJD3_9POAL|nr:hypothetical protein HU200_040792 [Digitaria exilis]